MPTKLARSLLVLVAGCAVAVGPGEERDEGDAGSAGAEVARTLVIEPATRAITIVDGAAVATPYRAYLVTGDGARTDVTSSTTFALADARFGAFDGAELHLGGAGAGPTRVIARAEGVIGTSALEVHVRATEYREGVPANAAEVFATAITGTNCGAQLGAPYEQTLVPANIGGLDVAWTGGASDLFEVRVANAYAERIIYTRDPSAVSLDASAWAPFATSRDRATIHLAGVIADVAWTKCVASPRTIRITDQDAIGGVYYSADGTLVRHELGGGAAAPVFASGDSPAACVGCHALSRDGARMAVTLDGASGRGAVIDFPSRGMLMTSAEHRWSSATFTPDGDRLLAVDAGQLKLFDVDSGTLLQTFASTHVTGNPEISPDGTQLVTVETPAGADWLFATAEIVVRSFHLDTLGERRVVLPYDATGGVQSFYPSWSPDGRWLAVTRASSGSSYANPTSDIFVVAADGSHAPIAVTDTHGNAWARWLPAETTIDGERVYFLSFTSQRTGREQLWLAPFYPDRAFERPATGPAFRAPFQDATTNNRNAQWTTGIVE